MSKASTVASKASKASAARTRDQLVQALVAGEIGFHELPRDLAPEVQAEIRRQALERGESVLVAARSLKYDGNTLYDRNVNLIVSAEAAPDQLYDGRRLAERFARTRSRLEEMQSHEYLARPHLP